VKTIATKGGIHNVYLTPDAKYIVAGSIAGKHLEVIDAATDQFASLLPGPGFFPLVHTARST
jgi:hypothetical protein